jgi:hypothetical protein
MSSSPGRNKTTITTIIDRSPSPSNRNKKEDNKSKLPGGDDVKANGSDFSKVKKNRY